MFKTLIAYAYLANPPKPLIQPLTPCKTCFQPPSVKPKWPPRVYREGRK